MRKKQFEIYHSKSLDEKLRMVTDMMEFSIRQTKAVLRQWHPDKTEAELKIEFFKLYYRDDFTPEKMSTLVAMLKSFEK